ncbi:hypothetical protein K1719_041189 [Acacia pycnantha]|nr:hypothetical protein K1719_041189 [Acacia pycnantha]
MLCDLEKLKIHQCCVDMIVAKDQVSESVAVKFEFPRLTSLLLYGLPNLRNFYLQRHTLEWPHLQRLSIHKCDELEIFEKEVSSSSEIYEEESTLNSKYPLFSHDKVIHNLEELELEGKPAEMIGSGQFPMYHFPKVKLLHLYADEATIILYKTLLKSFPNLEELELNGPFVEAFGGDDAATLASPFPKLTLYNIPITGSLSPLLFSSPNLTRIEVIQCDAITLMTSSTARSLVHLTHLSIDCCNHIEEIITKQAGENDEDKEIVFVKLKTLVLHALVRLKRFCGYNYTLRFPLLDQLVINTCPLFKIFSLGLVDTPSLKSIQLSQDGEKQQHEVWDDDLNKTFNQQRFMVSREVDLDEDDARMIRNHQFPADCCPQAEILRIEGFVEEWVTFPYTLLDRFPKLNELHVENSSFREIFPSYAPSSTSFHSLTVLTVSQCHQLVYLMTISTAESLVNLETLGIYNCRKLKEIIRKEPNEDVKEGITLFNIEDRATNTRCTNIPISLFSHNKLTMFCPGVIHAPRLQSVQVHTDKAHKDIWMTDLNNTIKHLFTFEEVISTTSSMAINAKNITRIVDVFPKVSFLYVESFMDEGVTFPYISLIRFPELYCLYVEHCSFEEIFPSQYHIINFLGKIPPFRVLNIAYMDKLKSIWKDDSQLPPIHQDLYFLQVKSCSSLVKLAPSSTSFQNLGHLHVSRCHQLIHLVTTSTAKSLVSLRLLEINDCKRMEEIVMNDTNEDVQGEITFNELNFIKLTDMPSLKMFSSQSHTFEFPELKEVEISGCPEMKMFCPGVLKTPKLSKVKIEEHGMEWKDEEDLNKTMEELSSAKV